jgi:hypothetical protein
MTERWPVEVTNLDRYRFPELPWSRPGDRFATGRPAWDRHRLRWRHCLRRRDRDAVTRDPPSFRPLIPETERASWNGNSKSSSSR